jgi:hypothetical protein
MKLTSFNKTLNLGRIIFTREMKNLGLFFVLFVISSFFANAEAALLQKGMGEDQCLESNTIHLGDSVVWVNYFDRTYQVTSVDIFDHVDGIFDSGLVHEGGVFAHSFDQIGDYAYFCSVPHQAHGMIKVVDINSPSETNPVLDQISNGSNLKAVSSNGSIMAILVASNPEKGKIIPIQIFFTGKYGEPLSDVNYAIIALQEERLIPIEYGDRQPDGKMDYNVGPMESSNPLVIQLRLLGLGHPHEVSYVTISSGEVLTLQVERNLQEQLSVSQIREANIPKWFRNVLSWYDGNLVTEKEVLDGFKYLIEKNIIRT